MYNWLQSGLTSLGIATLALTLLPVDALASDLVELRDGNSVLRTDIFKFNTQEAWFVDGANTLFTDLYFFNLGSNPAQRELRLEDLDRISLEQPTENRLRFNGQLSAFDANLNFSLDSTLYGGEVGSFQARREDVVQVSSTAETPLDFTLFSYIDYDLRLDDRFDNDTLSFANNTLTQTDPSGLEATLMSLDRTPSAVRFEEYPFLIAQLYDDNRTTLQPTVGPLTSTDGTAAFQFDETIQPGKTLTFRFVKQVQKKATPVAVPEPTMLLSFGIVVGGLVALQRR